MINIGIYFENKVLLSLMHNEISRCFDLHGIDYNIHCYRNITEMHHKIRIQCPELLFYDITEEYGLMRLAVISIKERNPGLISVVFKNNKYSEAIDNIILEPIYIIPDKSRKQIWSYALLAYESAFDNDNRFSYYKRPAYIHVPIDSIIYFVSEGRRIRIICSDDKHCNVFYKKLDDIETQISIKNYGFLRIHKSYLINEKYVAAYNRSHVALTTGELLPISKYEYYKKINGCISEKKLSCNYRLQA